MGSLAIPDGGPVMRVYREAIGDADGKTAALLNYPTADTSACAFVWRLVPNRSKGAA